MMTPTEKTIYIETYGCQMNEYDSGVIRTILKDAGYESVDSPDRAHVILLNTCAVRERAHERVLGRVSNLAHLKKKHPGTIIGLVGCMSQNLGETLFHASGTLDLVAGPDNYRELPQIIADLEERNAEKIARTILSREETYEEIRPAVVNGILAFVTIMRGCNNYCSYCVVPFTRGRERSRSPESVIDEIRDLLENHDIREVTLLGQNVNSYDYPGMDFTALVKRILQETSVQRVRFTSPHPHDFPASLMDLMASEPRFSPHIHLPVQSGATSVLKRMKRDYSREEFLNLVDRMREKVPHLGLSTDIITGFCGETDEEHEQTLSIMRQVRFDSAFMFKYSERLGTLAEKKYPDDVAEEVKSARLTQIIELQTSISAEKNRECVGQSYEVLAEGPSKRTETEWMGRTPGGKVVIFYPGPDIYPGKLLTVKIESSTSATLKGTFTA